MAQDLVDPGKKLDRPEWVARLNDEGRMWGKAEGERWAMVSVPPTASRRAIALAVAGLAAGPGGRTATPYLLDVLLADA